MIYIVGLGPGSKDALTLGTLKILENCKKIYLRTEKHPTVEYLKKLDIKFKTFDNIYDSSNKFDDVYNYIAMDIIKVYKEDEDIVYAVPGHPLVAEKSVENLIKMCNKNNIPFKILPAVSFIDSILESMQIDPINGVKIVDAFNIKNEILDKRIGTIVTQIYDKFIASEVKLQLMDYYGDEYEIFFIRGAGIEEIEKIKKIKLYELDREEDIDYLTSLYIPKDEQNTIKDFYDLLDIMDILRGEEGCPWDREQTHETLKRYLIEECYEVIEAVNSKDDDMIIEELGDVLFQIVFHCQIGKEKGHFNIDDVIATVCNKMIDRHPHVFKNNIVNSSKQVLENWEKIKKKEKGFKTYTEELKHIAKTLPALMRAEKVQKKAAKVGFDWNRVEDALDKVYEELNEVKDVYKNKNREKILEEVGDLIFSTVNVARFLDIDPENALNYTIEKFINRFEYIERCASKQGKSLKDMTLKEMDKFWEEAKIK